MKYNIVLTISTLLLSVQCFGQDPSTDRWIDNGDETRITIPATTPGKVLITKGNPNASGFNELLRAQVSHSPSEYIGFRNGTTGNSFVPVLLSFSENNAGSTLVLAGVTSPTGDYSSNSPMLLFDTRRHADNTLTSGADAITNRPLFAWRNYTTIHMQMLANGNLGLGTTSAQAQLHTTGSVRFAGLPGTTGTSVVMADAAGNLSALALPVSSTVAVVAGASTNAVPRFNKYGALLNGQIIDDGASVGVGGAPVDGSKLTLYGTLKLMSDARTKTNVVRMADALQKVNALNGYYYAYKSSPGGREVGFLAQEVERVLPEAVSENSDGVKFLNYDGVLPLLTEAIKEQQQLIQSQSALIQQLRQEVDALKRKR